MEEKKILREQLIKNVLIIFSAFLLLMLIFNIIIYKRVEISLYESIDKELKEIVESDESTIEINPRIIYIIRDEDGTILNQTSIGRFYDDYIDIVDFDKKHLNTIYTFKIDDEYNFRGITTTAYYKPTGEMVYIQLITNVDGEIQSLQNFRARLFGVTFMIITTSIVISYLLSRKTLSSIIENYKKQTEFVQNAAHELRTPLTIIQAKQQLLLQEPECKIIDKSEDINLTINETRRLGKLIKELMILATADSNKLKLNKEPIYLDKMLQDLVTPYIDYAEVQNKRLIVDLNYNKELNVDLNKISQLAIILLDNALKYTSEGEEIKFLTYVKDGKCNIEVSDTGIGITDEQKKHIFERFYRADKARSRETGGTGLGLSIAKTIVKLHGGSIKVTNNTPKGSKFIVRL